MSSSEMNTNPIDDSIIATKSGQTNPSIKQKDIQIRTASASDQRHISAAMLLAFNNDPVPCSLVLIVNFIFVRLLSIERFYYLFGMTSNMPGSKS